MSANFLAIDFETANSLRGSPCSIGLVEVRDGEVVSQRSELICPPNTFGPGDFDEMNIAIHGITWDMVADKPGFLDTWKQLGLDNLYIPLVAHYAAFDLGVIREAFAEEQCEWPTLNYICSVVLSRRVLDLPSYSLPYVADALGVTVTDHHDAGADAKACAEITLALLNRTSSNTLDDLLTSLNVRWGSLSPTDWSGSTVRGTSRTRDKLPPPRETASPDHYIYGKQVVITGTLPGGLLRRDAQDRIAFYGGTPQVGVTKDTDVLVVGDLDPKRLAPGMEVSAKLKKAFDLQAKGQHIEIIAGSDFMPYLD